MAWDSRASLLFADINSGSENPAWLSWGDPGEHSSGIGLRDKNRDKKGKDDHSVSSTLAKTELLVMP